MGRCRSALKTEIPLVFKGLRRGAQAPACSKLHEQKPNLCQLWRTADTAGSLAVLAPDDGRAAPPEEAQTHNKFAVREALLSPGTGPQPRQADQVATEAADPGTVTPLNDAIVQPRHRGQPGLDCISPIIRKAKTVGATNADGFPNWDSGWMARCACYDAVLTGFMYENSGRIAMRQ
jgi:hypothetical protein